MDTIKGRVNKKWTSTDNYRDNFDRIFGKKQTGVYCSKCDTTFDAELFTGKHCPVCDNQIVWDAADFK